MPRNDGRIEPGQRLNGAISARAWNRMLDAADLVLGQQYGATADGPGGAVHYLAKTTAAWNKGTSQTLNLWAGTPGSESQLSDQVIAWNKTGADIASGKWVLLARANGTFYVAEPEVIEQDVLTGVSLGSGGLVFTRETVYIVGKKTPAPSSVTINTTACT